jgi:hypothetical protein
MIWNYRSLQDRQVFLCLMVMGSVAATEPMRDGLVRLALNVASHTSSTLLPLFTNNDANVTKVAFR